MTECILKPCCDKGGELISLTRKGLDKIKQCSEIQQDGVKEMLINDASLLVHQKCRKRYTLRPKPPKEDGVSGKVPRSSFDFKTLCFLCGRKCVDISIYRNSALEKWSLVETIDIIKNVRTAADNRRDYWAEEVLVRISQVIDLVSSDGRYHKYCYQRFRIPGTSKPEKGISVKGGSTSDTNRNLGFEQFCDYLENNDECQYTFEELKQIFLQLNPQLEPYTDIHLKRKLIQRYGSNLCFADLPGKKSVVCFTGTASNILSDAWYKNRNKDDEAQEELRLIKTAAAIIRREVTSQSYDCSNFPTIDEFANGGAELVPELLRVLIFEIIKCTSKRNSPEEIERKKKITDRKTTTICHSIITAVRPRSFLSPVQLGTAVSLHRKFGSRILIDTLCNVGVCAPYREVLKYERSATSQNTTKIDKGYVQFVFDNADYNVHTLDGHNTFHVMGGIACVTPKSALQVEENVPRMNVTACAVENRGIFQLKAYRVPATSGYSKIVVTDMVSAQIKPEAVKHDRTLNLFWLCGTWLEGPKECRPGWSGCMEILYATKEYQTSAVVPLPFINLSPSNPATIYTALIQAAERGVRNGQSITMVTFDQPLYAKAREMVAAAPDDSPLKCLFIRLGGFHLLLSFLSSIGFIMAGSGLEELYSTVYAKNSVPQMMNGKAYSRVVRALYLVEEALITVFLKTNDACISVDKDELKSIYSAFKAAHAKSEDITQATAVKNFVESLEKQFQQSKDSGRTQKLWIQLIEMVEIIRMFVRAERSGDFHLHLHCVQQMLPIFHASGHLNYAKSAHVYIQDCLKLLTSLNATEYDLFITRGYFTIRRTEKFWSGVWSDMTIEQVLMRSLSSSGGLTGGRGITEATIATWINSMPICSRIVEAVEEFAGVRSVSSEHHVELREANQKRNSKDLQIFISWLEEHNPFSKPPELSSLSTGVVADEKVNCDEAFEIGVILLKDIENKTFNDIRLKRKLAVKSLATITRSVAIHNDDVCVNPNTLLHRMVCTVRCDEQLANIFKFELCAYPPSLFDESGLMRKGSKSSMMTVLLPKVDELSDVSDPGEVSYVIDGGHLLYHVVWQRPATFKQICQQYTEYVITHYGKATIIFDGYEKEYSTKDEEHLRRSRNRTYVEVKVEDAIFVTLRQDEFLSNCKNKTALISLLSEHLKRAGCKIHHAKGDADTLIVQTAIEEDKKGLRATVIGNDTDLLLLLIVHAPSNNQLKIVMPKKGNQQKKVFSIRDIQRDIGEMKDVLLAVYAFTGCDTVSAIYNKGKIIPFKRVQADKELHAKLLIFNDRNADPNAVADAGKHFLLSIFGSKSTNDLDHLRHQYYLQTIAKHPLHSMFKLASLPPTSEATKQHSFRAYHQVQQWLNHQKDPLKWGWKKVAGRLRPVTTTRPAVPEDLLSFIICTCKDECLKNCECQRAGLNCSSMCSNCTGLGCANRDTLIIDDELDDDLQLDEEKEDSMSYHRD